MNNYKFYKTDDNSTGIYCEDMKDILHSKTGAKKEAFDKFINPVDFDEFYKNKNNINILDICSGVGYNLKAALYKLKNKSVCIDCIDTDINLFFTSPFLVDGFNDIDINLHLLQMIIRNEYSIFDIYNLIKKIYSLTNAEFFSPSMMNLIEFIINSFNINNGQLTKNQFVHNIYYNYISNSMYNELKHNIYKNSLIYYHVADARKYILETKKTYDVIFLDAYTPKKQPSLWTINFLSEIKKHIDDNSVIVTYSKSTPFRSALVELGFSVGKILVDESDMGTIASFNSNKIKNKLNSYDLKLIETKSGITYKDYNFSLSDIEIIKNRQAEQDISSRQSRTQFSKNY